MYSQQFVVLIACASILGVWLSWSNALWKFLEFFARTDSSESAALEMRSSVLGDLLRAAVIGAAMCIAVWVMARHGIAAHSSAVSASQFGRVTVLAPVLYLAGLYGWAAIRRHSTAN